MNAVRFDELMRNPTAQLTPEECAFGWHFCCEFDYLLKLRGVEGCTCTTDGRWRTGGAA
jgi:hypothetical protein